MLREAGKPVIVSQGDVAASGGYWISMNGTEILTTPLTITGSIGVISGWVWDEEMHEKVGLNADGVSRGAHADVFRSIRYPLGFAVPHRDMTAEEYEHAEDRILTMYDRFVNAVAAGRGLEPESVREVGGGHVWMGGDATEHGLCDGQGGLMDAIARARQLAGIAPHEEVLLCEYPPQPMIQWPQLSLPLPGLRINLPTPMAAASMLQNTSGEPESPEMEFLRSVVESRGAPRLMLTPGCLPEAWSTAGGIFEY